MKTVMVCGPRNYRSYVFICGRMVSLGLEPEDLVISGGAPGVDTLVAQWCSQTRPSARFQEYTAEWSRLGKKAGPIRNQQMVDACDYALVIWDGKSAGTRDSIRRLITAGKPFSIFVRTDPLEFNQ